jgi:glycosyltransferase involved in cell wall biosynthesis
VRVLLVANTAASMVWFRLPLLRALRAAGHQVWVMAPDGWGVDRILAESVSFLPLPHRQGFSVDAHGEGRHSYLDALADLDTARAIRRACRTVRPDVMLAYTHKMAMLAAPAARAAGVRRVHVMVTGMGYAHLGGSPVRELLRQAYHAGLRVAGGLADSMIVLNRDNLDDARRLRLAPPDRLFLLDGEGVDTAAYAASPPELTPGAPVFLTVARLVRHKGIYEVVDAARQVRRTHPNARFILAGSSDGRHPDAVPEAVLAAWRREGVVELVGQVEDVRPLLRECTCFVLPSDATEGLPMSLMEAMSASRPLITSRVAGNRETVEEGENGHLVPYGDAGALTSAMRRLASDADLVRSMGASSRRIAERRFDHRVVNVALMNHLGL